MAADKGQAEPPPPDIASRTFDLTEISIDPYELWHRIGKAARNPMFFSTSDDLRFSRPDTPGTLYLGGTAETCFWECFWDDLVSRPPTDQRLDAAKVNERAVWSLILPGVIRVVDTYDGATLRAIRAHGSTFGGPYDVCQQWAKALREHPLKPDGILYESVRNRGGKCLALFAERCAGLAWNFGKGVPLTAHSDLTRLIAQQGLPAII